MTLVVPNVAEVIAAQKFLTLEDLTLKLYSNNVIPSESNTASSFTAVTGGGYAAKTLDKDNWTTTSGDPTSAVYEAQDFAFTGATGAPGTIYGYYVIDGSGILRWAERFDESVLPFIPVNGSLIRITPKIQIS